MLLLVMFAAGTSSRVPMGTLLLQRNNRCTVIFSPLRIPNRATASSE
jgi:hypothetical protein